MKKVLILAYDFPPFFSVGGLRPYSWYKYLKEFGLHPVVVTRQWPASTGNPFDFITKGISKNNIIEETESGTLIRAPYFPTLANKILLKHGKNKFSFFRKLISGFFDFTQYFLFVGPYSPLFFSARKYLNSNKVECIIATGGPFVLYKYASRLSKEFNTPWIADFRDLWSHSPARSRNIMLKLRNIFFERSFLRNACCITTVSEFLRLKLSDTYKQKKIFTIRNGYDPALLDADLFPNKSPNELVISFMGTLYSWHPLEAFLVTLADLLREEKTIKIRLLFWGIHKQEEVIKLVNKNSQHLAGIIEFRPRVENPNLRAIKQQSDLFLLFNDYALIGTKIYDYLALKRCIILCFSEEPNPDKLKPPYVKDFNKGISTMAQAELIEETNSGFVIKSPEHLKETIKRLSIELKMKGLVKCQSRGIEPYSRKVQTQNLARIIFGFKNSNE